MKLHLSVFFYFFLSCLLKQTKAASDVNKNGVYVVYMGAAPSLSNSLTDHAQLLSSLLQRNRDVLVHSYKRSFAGFAARLSEEAANSIAKEPGVVSVFSDPIFKLHTTRSWDFLSQHAFNLQTNYAHLDPNHDLKSAGSDTIIGIIDSGIWPESESFNDKDMGPIPSRWKGTCMKGHAFNSSNCNRKLIGARYYNDREDPPEYKTARDDLGHGTHVASTAAGRPVEDASYYGLAKGTARGGSPGSRIAMYKACTPDGCRGSALLAAFDDAITDGVDVISLSVGGDVQDDFLYDPIAIGGFHAVEKGILVVCSAGNGGPISESVVNIAPWILTAAATTIDRDFQANIVLGSNEVIEGEAINFARTKRNPAYPLILGSAAKLRSASDARSARKCTIGALDKKKIKGKIVVCNNNGENYDPTLKLSRVVDNGGIGIILIDDASGAVATTFGTDPLTVIDSKEAEMIISYMNSTRKPRATILKTVTVLNHKPAPQVAFFSARGPSPLLNSKNILKPDIAAPGVDILAAWMGNDESITPHGMKPPLFNIMSGTSMACPHVSGIGATVKSRHPSWSPSAIKSAIMTTATNSNNIRAPITTDHGSRGVHNRKGSRATPYDIGAGEVSLLRALQPGLIYETNKLEYLTLLCNYHYSLSQIKSIASYFPPKFSCPKNSGTAYISNMNYPSISISGYNGKGSKTIKRRVRNVGYNVETNYTAILDVPVGLKVKVIPSKLQFTKKVKNLSYRMIFSASVSSMPVKDLFGSITWTNGMYHVRSPFAVSRRPLTNVY